MEVKYKKLNEEAITPTKAHLTDAGIDLHASGFGTHGDSYLEYVTGISLEIPEGHVGLLFPRSSISEKDLILSNSVGVIDSGYRGEIKFRFHRLGSRAYKKGDKIGQLIILPYPSVVLTETTTLNESDRGSGGFGSSGR